MEINNYPNYLIYEDGRIWSKNYNGTKTGRFLKLYLNKLGYKIAQLWNEYGKKYKTVHRLVAETYIPNPNNLPLVDHINQVRDDNRVENLRWATVSENKLNSDKVSSNTGFTYIYQGKLQYQIHIRKLKVCKRYSKKKYSLEEVVFFRDMILDS